jgi:hypothetical protein
MVNHATICCSTFDPCAFERSEDRRCVREFLSVCAHRAALGTVMANDEKPVAAPCDIAARNTTLVEHDFNIACMDVGNDIVKRDTTILKHTNYNITNTCLDYCSRGELESEMDKRACEANGRMTAHSKRGRSIPKENAAHRPRF